MCYSCDVTCVKHVMGVVYVDEAGRGCYMCYSCDVSCVKRVYVHRCCAVYPKKEPGRQCYMCYSSGVTFVTCYRCRVDPQLLCNV